MLSAMTGASMPTGLVTYDPAFINARRGLGFQESYNLSPDSISILGISATQVLAL